MSRYVIAEEPELVVVGWDPPLETYFLQIYDPKEADDEKALKVWLGTNQGEMESVAYLSYVVDTFTEEAEISPELRDQLESDRINGLKPSPLQERMIAIFGRRR